MIVLHYFGFDIILGVNKVYLRRHSTLYFRNELCCHTETPYSAVHLKMRAVFFGHYFSRNCLFDLFKDSCK